MLIRRHIRQAEITLAQGSGEERASAPRSRSDSTGRNEGDASASLKMREANAVMRGFKQSVVPRAQKR